VKKIALCFVCSFVFLFLTGCDGNQEILQRLDALESEVALLSETVDAMNADAETSAEGTVDGQTAEQPTPTPLQKTELSYETITDVLGKANIMNGLDDTFQSGTICISADGFFIYLTYACSLTDDVMNTINQTLRENYGGAEFSKTESGFVGDGDYMSIGENDDGTLSIGFELCSMDTISKVYQLDEEYFSSCEAFGISQDVLDQYGLPAPSHTFSFEEDGTISTSLDWELDQEQTNQLASYYAKEFLGDETVEMADAGAYLEGSADDGTKLVFSANNHGDSYGVSLKRIYKEA